MGGLHRGASSPQSIAADKPFMPAQRQPIPESSMKIAKDSVVRFHYSVSERTAHEQGQEPLETSKEREPLAVLIGHGNIIPGLENAMQDREAGESFGVDVAATDAYGERREGLTQRVPKKHFGNQKLVPGQQVILQTNFGPRAVTVEKIGMSVVDVDLNHPMAGKDLHFDVEIVDVREASKEELEHGHVHGDGGHHH
jgi:FKBP-type peptidyl-prolyl cis-trans isomerase SlyD